MARVLVLVEGQTEETFVRDVLSPHLADHNVFIRATLATNKKVKFGPTFRGGVTSYPKIKRDVQLLLMDTSASLVTTMIDFYGLPSDFPGYGSIPAGSCHKKVAHLERAFNVDIGNSRFRPYLQTHEYEAFLFVSPEDTARVFADQRKARNVRAVLDQFETAEDINDNPSTAPSKRIANIFSEYQKAVHGPLIAVRTGIQNLRNHCKHFNEWLTMLENLGTQI
ncbi:MAG: hypothetical protein OJF52_003649 [Nitrospira sp.]|jgi:hypothetical protein|nr:MAG: hypothetical protein OJF52_003649 [Nitrospira sp.]